MKFSLLLSLLFLGLSTGASAEEVNFVGITQLGAGNNADIDQADGHEARASLHQLGGLNVIDLTQAGNAEAVLLQNGQGNSALLNQRGRPGGSAEVWLYQTGNNNSAALTQDGASNRALATQTGEANLLELTQVSDDNSATLLQDGVGLVLLVTQTGGADITITQRGP
jgi:minor curlin subunit